LKLQDEVVNPGRFVADQGVQKSLKKVKKKACQRSLAFINEEVR